MSLLLVAVPLAAGDYGMKSAIPKLNVHYTRDLHDLKMRMLEKGITPESHANLLATNQSYAMISNSSYIIAASISKSASQYSVLNLERFSIRSVPSLRGRANPSLILPTWTNIPVGNQPSSTGGLTYNADINTGDFVITAASGGTVLSFSACGAGSSGDTYLRLVDTNGKQLAYDDDSCGTPGGSSAFNYTVPGSALSTPTLTLRVGCFHTSTCSATVTVTGISSYSMPPTSASTLAPSASPSTPAPTTFSTSTSQYPIYITGWYAYTASIGLSSVAYLPQGLDTVIDRGLTILQWTNCACARYRWGNAEHTFINDIYGYPLIYLVANRASITPSRAPKCSPSQVPTTLTATPSFKSSNRPIAPSARPSAAPVRSIRPSARPSAAPVRSIRPSAKLSAAPTSAIAPQSAQSSAAPIASSSRAPTSQYTPTSQIPVPFTGWYEYTASIGLSSISYLPKGLDTVIDLGYTILRWTNCGCARYTWGNAAHTFINDTYGYPLIYLKANVPTTLPTIAPTAPTATPSIRPSVAPIFSKAPTNVVLSYNLIYHGGKIIQVPVVKLIFWGPSWQTNPGDKITGMDLFYKGWTDSEYANLHTEFYGTNGQATGSIIYQGYVIDSSPANSINGNVILSRVCSQITDTDPNGNGYYVVYTETPRGSAGYCGWHSYGYCNGVPVQIAFIFNLDGDNACSVGSPAPNPGWQMSQGVHALAGVSVH
eukprot:gene23598-30600_t